MSKGIRYTLNRQILYMDRYYQFDDLLFIFIFFLILVCNIKKRENMSNSVI